MRSRFRDILPQSRGCHLLMRLGTPVKMSNDSLCTVIHYTVTNYSQVLLDQSDCLRGWMKSLKDLCENSSLSKSGPPHRYPQSAHSHRTSRAVYLFVPQHYREAGMLSLPFVYHLSRQRSLVVNVSPRAPDPFFQKVLSSKIPVS